MDLLHLVQLTAASNKMNQDFGHLMRIRREVSDGRGRDEPSERERIHSISMTEEGRSFTSGRELAESAKTGMIFRRNVCASRIGNGVYVSRAYIIACHTVSYPTIEEGNTLTNSAESLTDKIALSQGSNNVELDGRYARLRHDDVSVDVWN